MRGAGSIFAIVIGVFHAGTAAATSVHCPGSANYCVGPLATLVNTPTEYLGLFFVEGEDSDPPPLSSSRVTTPFWDIEVTWGLLGGQIGDDTDDIRIVGRHIVDPHPLDDEIGPVLFTIYFDQPLGEPGPLLLHTGPHPGIGHGDILTTSISPATNPNGTTRISIVEIHMVHVAEPSAGLLLVIGLFGFWAKRETARRCSRVDRKWTILD